jgi:hypothetical protein
MAFWTVFCPERVRELNPSVGGYSMQRALYEFAGFLAASWRLANGDARIPTSHGILDEALHELQLQSLVPQPYRDVISFGNTRVGFRCYELPEILYCAQANLLTSEPNPTYLTTSVQIDEDTARRLVKRLGISPMVAREFGKQLSEEAKKAQQSVESSEASEVA